MGEIFFEKFEVAIYSNVQLKNNCKFTYWALLSLREISAISLWYAKSWRVGWQPLTSISNRISWYLEALNNILFSSISAIISFLLFQFLKAQTDRLTLTQSIVVNFPSAFCAPILCSLLLRLLAPAAPSSNSEQRRQIMSSRGPTLAPFPHA